MKITFLIKEGVKQLVLTPELEADKQIFKLFNAPEKVKVYRGSFYEKCQGGWVREYKDDDSLILVVE